jgi:hypothetical protein
MSANRWQLVGESAALAGRVWFFRKSVKTCSILAMGFWDNDARATTLVSCLLCELAILATCRWPRWRRS